MTADLFFKGMGKGPGFTMAYVLTLLLSAALLLHADITSQTFGEIVKFTTATFFAGGVGKVIGDKWGGSNGASRGSGQ